MTAQENLKLRRAAAEEVKSGSSKEMNMTDQELKDLVAGLAISQSKTDAALAALGSELRESIKAMQASTDRLSTENEKTSKQIKAVNEELGGVGKSQGMVTEEFFYNSLKINPHVAGIKFDTVSHHLHKASEDKEVEIDVFLENGKSIALAEVKYRVRTKDVEQVKKTIKGFRELFPHYKDYTLYAGVAGFSFEDEALDMAQENGLFVLKRSGNVIETAGGALKTF